jgi:hypothetical protein
MASRTDIAKKIETISNTLLSQFLLNIHPQSKWLSEHRKEV